MGGLGSTLICQPLLHGLDLGVDLVQVPAPLLMAHPLGPELPELGPPDGPAL